MIALTMTVIAALMFLAALLLAGTLLNVTYQLKQWRVRCQEEAAWAEEYARRAAKAEKELAELRRAYAVLQWINEGTDMLVLGAAWRAGVRVGKGRVGA